MPKKTFFNLPDDKKETLVNAARKEFSRVPLFEASISNIIKQAGIPRGSFYQYFEDKEDIYFFLLDEYTKRNNDRFISILKKQEGDLIHALIDFYPIMLKNFQNIELRNFYRNAFLNMNYKVENKLTRHVNEEQVTNHYLNVIGLIDTKRLNITSDEEIHHILKITRAVTFQNLSYFFAKQIPIDESIRNYSLEINLLKRGIYKEEI